MDTIKLKEELQNEFLNYAIEHEEKVNEGNHEEANRIHNALTKLYKKSTEQINSDIFSEFMNHDNENIRLWSAVFTLNTDATKAKEVLNQISKSSSITALTALTVLDMWEKGMMDLI
nr:hypothetical protein [uncultured Allomuricauda sp.]